MSNNIKLSRFLGAVIMCTSIAFSGCGEMTGDSGGTIRSAGSDITGPTTTNVTTGGNTGGSTGGNTGGSLTLLAACNYSTYKYCVEYSASTNASTTGLCTGGSTVTSCSTSNKLGTCTQTTTSSEFTFQTKTIYYTGSTNGQSACTSSGGSWSTN